MTPPSLKNWLTQTITGPDGNKTKNIELYEPPLPATENYPFQYVRETLLKGDKIRLRPIRPDDDELMLDLFTSFSEETIYHRFFTHITMTPSRVKRFTRIDYIKQMALVAIHKNKNERQLMGVARYAAMADKEGWAEMAIVVGDPWQKQGLGTKLLRFLVDVARNEGYHGLIGLVHYENPGIDKMFKKLGIPYRERDTGTEMKYEIPLKHHQS